MPEFEEPEAASSSKENYTPSTDATKKPRTRRRSGGFKTEYTAPSLSIGEVEAAEALKKEKLSGRAKPESNSEKEEATRAATKKPARRPERKSENPGAKVGNADPSAETLAAIQRVEARLNERRAERDTRRAEKDKNRSGKSEKSSDSRRTSSDRKPQSKGILASILSFFGLGSKPQPAKKKNGQGRPSGSRGQGNRPPRSKNGGNNRGPGSDRRGSGKGRSRGGKNPRRSDRRSREPKS